MAPGVPTYYSNRAAAWIRIGAFKEAVADCRQVGLFQIVTVKFVEQLLQDLGVV